MKKTIFSVCGLSIGLTLLWGCSRSNPDAATKEQTPNPAPGTEASAPPAPRSASPAEKHDSKKKAVETPATASVPAASSPAPSTPPAVSAPATPPTVPPATLAANIPAAAPAVPTATASAASNTVSQFLATSKAKGDKVLSSVSSDLADKVNALAQSAEGNDALKVQLTNSLKSFVSGNDASGLTTLYQTAQTAALTPPQLQLAKDVGNLASAYVVQKNFASLDGAQGDVATIVSSLREGQIAPALPALQKVAQNASLTPPQKELVGSIADKYAPGVSKAAGLLQQGLQRIPGLGGSGK